MMMTDLYPGAMLQPGQELLLRADPLHPQLPPLRGHQHTVSANNSHSVNMRKSRKKEMCESMPVACGPIHQVPVTSSQALHRVLHPRDEQVLCILTPEYD